MLNTISLVLGILSLVFACIAFIPCLGILNWGVLPFGIVSLIVSAVAYSQNNDITNKTPKTAIILCVIAVLVSLFRLILGGGIL